MTLRIPSSDFFFFRVDILTRGWIFLFSSNLCVLFFQTLLHGRFPEIFNNRIFLFVKACGESKKIRLLRTASNSNRIPDGIQDK